MTRQDCFWGVLVRSISVQAIVLYHEEEIEEDGFHSQAKLWNVPDNISPVVSRIYDELCNTKEASCEIQQDVTNTPADCGLSSTIQKRLWDVLDEAGPHLRVRQKSQ